jgi:hypothetical protein
VSIPPFRRVAALFLPAAAALTMAAGLTFLAVQQDLRIGANDLPQQLAEDGVAALNGGAAPATVVGSGSVPIESSLAPFVAVFDGQGTLLATNGSLDGEAPAPPIGVLRSARASGRDAVTWQPQAGVRIALVALPWNGGTVVAGRSLRVIESRIDALQVLIGAGLLAGLIVLAVVATIAASLWSASKP